MIALLVLRSLDTGDYINQARTDDLEATVLGIYKRMGCVDAEELTEHFMCDIREELCPVIENPQKDMLIEFIV